jgi:hypothetical protein
VSTKFSAEGFEADQRWMWLYTTSDRRSPDVGELRDRFQFEDGVDFGFEYSRRVWPLELYWPQFSGLLILIGTAVCCLL